MPKDTRKFIARINGEVRDIQIEDFASFQKLYPKLVVHIPEADELQITNILDLGASLTGVSIIINPDNVAAQNVEAAKSSLINEDTSLVDTIGDGSPNEERGLSEDEKKIEQSMKSAFNDGNYKIPDGLRMREDEAVRDFSYRLQMEYRNRNK